MRAGKEAQPYFLFGFRWICSIPPPPPSIFLFSFFTSITNFPILRLAFTHFPFQLSFQCCGAGAVRSRIISLDGSGAALKLNFPKLALHKPMEWGRSRSRCRIIWASQSQIRSGSATPFTSLIRQFLCLPYHLHFLALSTVGLKQKIFVFVFSRKFCKNFFSLFAKIFAKTFAKAKIFAKRNFAKSERIFAYFSENEKRGFRFNPTSTALSLS
jgi:hypothetical protein